MASIPRCLRVGTGSNPVVRAINRISRYGVMANPPRLGRGRFQFESEYLDHFSRVHWLALHISTLEGEFLCHGTMNKTSKK